ncbi:unnamed protein product [Amoebophrya sp. A25]|nr:unnamed protein product [Amoebophrya sp. A25]|eukprot:GSA25T00010554001.1
MPSNKGKKKQNTPASSSTKEVDTAASTAALASMLKQLSGNPEALKELLAQDGMKETLATLSKTPIDGDGDHEKEEISAAPVESTKTKAEVDAAKKSQERVPVVRETTPEPSTSRGNKEASEEPQTAAKKNNKRKKKTAAKQAKEATLDAVEKKSEDKVKEEQKAKTPSQDAASTSSCTPNAIGLDGDAPGATVESTEQAAVKAKKRKPRKKKTTSVNADLAAIKAEVKKSLTTETSNSSKKESQTSSMQFSIDTWKNNGKSGMSLLERRKEFAQDLFNLAKASSMNLLADETTSPSCEQKDCCKKPSVIADREARVRHVAEHAKCCKATATSENGSSLDVFSYPYIQKNKEKTDETRSMTTKNNSSTEKILFVNNEYYGGDVHDSFEVVPIPGKGMGCVAKRDLAPGELILEERPILYSSRRDVAVMAMETRTKVDSVDVMVRNFEKNLPAQARNAILTLAKQEEGESRIRDVILTNTLGAGENRVRLLLTLSRLNHSCAPNCALEELDDAFFPDGFESSVEHKNVSSSQSKQDPFMNHKSGKFRSLQKDGGEDRNPQGRTSEEPGVTMSGYYAFNRVRTTRYVRKGEELCFPYIPLFDSVDQRRKRLQDTWGFFCTCSGCVDEEKARHEESEAALRREEESQERDVEKSTSSATSTTCTSTTSTKGENNEHQEDEDAPASNKKENATDASGVMKIVGDMKEIAEERRRKTTMESPSSAVEATSESTLTPIEKFEQYLEKVTAAELLVRAGTTDLLCDCRGRLSRWSSNLPPAFSAPVRSGFCPEYSCILTFLMKVQAASHSVNISMLAKGDGSQGVRSSFAEEQERATQNTLTQQLLHSVVAIEHMEFLQHAPWNMRFKLWQSIFMGMLHVLVLDCDPSTAAGGQSFEAIGLLVRMRAPEILVALKNAYLAALFAYGPYSKPVEECQKFSRICNLHLENDSVSEALNALAHIQELE